MNQKNLKISYLAQGVNCWRSALIEEFDKKILKILAKQNYCSIMLTGGRAANSFYHLWNQSNSFKNLHNVTFYLSDERLVPIADIKSNTGMILSTLFVSGIPNNCKFEFLENEDSNNISLALNYEKRLAESIDILLLSLGDDGHIASLFPYSEELNMVHRRCVIVKRRGEYFDRLSITKSTILSSKNIYTLAIGEAKMKMMNQLLVHPSRHEEFPGRIVLHGNWVTGYLTT
jgi:6-phosphogluconolactonase